MHNRILSFFLFFVMAGPTPAVLAAEVALLISSEIPAYSKAILGIKRALPSHTLLHEYRMKGDMARGKEMAKSIRALNPDVVIVVGLKAALISKVEILDQPIVFCMVTNPSPYGLPTRNMTGILMDTSIQQQLNSIKTVLPDVRRIGLLFHEDHSRSVVADARHYAKTLRISLHALPVASHEEVPPTVRQLVQDIDALWLIRDPLVVNPESLEYIMDRALDHNLPVFGFSTGLMNFGALGTFSADYYEMGRQTGHLAVSLLGTRTRGSALPLPRNPTYSELALNLNAADFLGLSLPPKALQLASQLFGGPGAFAGVEQSEKLEFSDDPIFMP